jgi:hypothetical protein
MKLLFTKADLITAWLLAHPNDPDYYHNALGGYIETKDGFVEYTYYQYYKKGWIKCPKDSKSSKQLDAT